MESPCDATWASFSLAGDESTSVGPPLAGEHAPNRVRVNAMFLDENPRAEALRRVVVEDRHRGLQHNRSRVELVRDEMDRRAAHADAILQRLSLCVQTGERRQQR